MPPSTAMVNRWRTGRHVGPSKPRQVVKIQPGLMDRTYMPFDMLNGAEEHFGEIARSTHNDRPWQAFWRATGAWRVVPNVSQVDIEQGFDANGIATATITIQNVFMQRVVGVLGTFTAIKRGYLSPWLGFRAAGRPFTDQQVNEWFDLLNGGYRIKVWQGYGDLIEPEFTGLVDDTDIRPNPDVITITARDFGQLLTDQRAFGSVKAKELRSPITFADRNDADDTVNVSAGAVASSSDIGYPAANVSKKDDTYWRSDPHTADATEWIELHLPAGRYTDFYLDPQYAGMECWVSVYLRNRRGNQKSTVDGVETGPGWVARGVGNVPGANGGHPFVRHIPSLGSLPTKPGIGFSMICGDNTVLRLSFRNLPPGGDGKRRAGVRRLIAYKRKRKAEIKKTKRWVYVNDGTDIVKWVLMWAGFKEWEVEPFGVNIAEPLVFHQSDYLIDIINHMKDQANYVFYIRRPTEDDGSIGVPVFRRASALDEPTPNMVDIRDTNLLTGLETRFSKEALAYIIRFRGSVPKKGGVALGEDTAKRVQATYLPPWSGAHHSVTTGVYDRIGMGRLAGVIKHVVHNDKMLETEEECMMACILTAIQEALESYTGNVQIPGLPGLSLDEQVSVIDAATGTNQRLWTGHRNSSFTTGEDGAYVLTLGGSMIDTPDLEILLADYRALLRKVSSQ